MAQPLPVAARPAARVTAGVALLVLGLLAVAVLAGIDIGQGTAHVAVADIADALVGRGDGTDGAVVAASRLPRAVAGILVGVALGVAGGAMQSVSRNVLAAPDTLAVNAGAYLALGIVAVTGVSVPLVAQSGAAFLGGIAAAAVVLALSGPGHGTVRLVLAGSALALGLAAATEALLLLFPEATNGLYAWSRGSISQNGFGGIGRLLPIVLLGTAGFLAVSRRLDALALGDEAARSLGIRIGPTRVVALGLAVLLSAVAVTLAGPIGFVGLCAPALGRPLARRFPTLHRTWAFLGVAALTGTGVVLGSDVLLRAVAPADTAVAIPTGVVTSVVGAAFLVAVAVRSRDSGGAMPLPSGRFAGRARVAAVLSGLVIALLGSLVAAVLLGDAKLLLGDVANWANGRAGSAVSFILDTRTPRVTAAVLAGAALALAGTIVQGVTRNPLADPAVLGVSNGAGLGAVLAVTVAPAAGAWGSTGAAFAGAGVAAAIVFGLAACGGFRQNRLVLVGVGVSSALAACIGLAIVLTDPFNQVKALTWLSGSTYGRTFADVLPVSVALVLVTALVAGRVRQLDLVSLDEDTPRLLGIGLSTTRLAFLGLSVLLMATAIAAVGTIGFVGLVAPHAARSLVGRRHARVVPVAMLLGAILVTIGDLLGRTVIAPAQLGAGVLTAMIGTPYFIWLLARTPRPSSR